MAPNETLMQKDAWTPVGIDRASLFGEERVQASSEAQREIFSAALSDPDSSRAYNLSISLFLDGSVDLDALYSALLNLIDRHEALRATFSPEGDEIRVRGAIPFSLPVIDLSERSEAAQKGLYEDLVRRELEHPFDLVNGPLFRCMLVKRGERKWTLVFNTHHIVVDGWSLKIIMAEIPRLYSALRQGGDESSVIPSSSYLQYLGTTVTREKEASAKTKRFWKGVYEDGVPVLDLPVDKARPVYRTYGSKREDYKVDRATYERLKEAGAKAGVSQFITLFSTFALYLSRVSGQADFVLGVPSAGQITSGKANLLGHDARVLPIRCQVEPNDTFATFAKRVMERFLAAYENQWISMPALIQELKVPVDPARVPFVPVLFNFDPGMKPEDFHFEGIKTSHLFNHRSAEIFEISVNAVVEYGELILETAFNTDLFEPAEMHERLAQVETLMASIAAGPATPVAKLAILPTAQVERMDRALNSTGMPYERALCVEDLIERVARNSPRRVAVEYADAQLDYRAIWELSGKVASAILEQGLGPKPLVGVLLDRSESLVPVLLGIWRAGGAFVPLDPSYPADRLQYMVDHSGIRLVLSQPNLKSILKGESLRYLDAAEILASKSLRPLESSVPGRSPDDIAYVIYTSGSTGLPKGVKVPQRALNNFLTTMRDQAPGISAEDRVLAVTTLSFDIAELELWLPLVSGARVVIVDRATAVDGLALIETIESRKISFIQATPATWRLLLLSEWKGDARITALCGGEALPRELADEIQKRVGSLWNVYGPTETTVWSTIDRVKSGPITIGKPIGNTQTYVLDPQGAWVPRGSVGELWIGGDGVTEGYLGRDDLTSERFVPNGFTGHGRIYKTGDLVRLRLDGRIEYVGRNDFQVKVRGFRIELGEVQHALSRSPAIRQCVVIVSEKSPGDAHLVAYCTLKPGMRATAAELKQSMRGAVPDYMIPTYFVELPELPLTNNGKINVKALPAPFAQSQARDEEFDAPQGETETYLARVWTEVIGLNRVGRKDRFLTLGGSSLQAIRVIQRVLKDRSYRIAPKSIFMKTLEQLALELSGPRPATSEIAPRPATQAPSLIHSPDQGEVAAFFGAEAKRKFSYFYPCDARAEAAVLICPPLGQEYMRTHWLIRDLATSIRQAGLPVMRFDYYGQGDSSGLTEEARLEDYLESIREAAQELRSRSGAARIKIVAFRASALFVDRVAQELGSGTETVYVDPVASGAKYLDELRRVQERRWDAYPYKKTWIKGGATEELLGFLYSRELLQGIETLTLSETARATTVLSTPSAGWDDSRRLEKIWLSPELIRQVKAALMGGPS